MMGIDNLDEAEDFLATGKTGIINIIYTKRRKKFEKWIKTIPSEKLIIDISRSWSKEEGVDYSKSISFKLMVWRKMLMAIERGKQVYYIPDLSDNRSTVEKHLEMKKLFPEGTIFRAILFNDYNVSGFDEIEKITDEF